MSKNLDQKPLLIPPEVQGLCKILTNFSEYQALAFPAREPSFFALELAGECGELANIEKKIWRDPLRTELKQLLPHEAADVFITLINYCNSRSINLETAVNEKLQEIETRRSTGKMGRTK